MDASTPHERPLKTESRSTRFGFNYWKWIKALMFHSTCYMRRVSYYVVPIKYVLLVTCCRLHLGSPEQKGFVQMNYPNFEWRLDSIPGKYKSGCLTGFLAWRRLTGGLLPIYTRITRSIEPFLMVKGCSDHLWSRTNSYARSNATLFRLLLLLMSYWFGDLDLTWNIKYSIKARS